MTPTEAIQQARTGAVRPLYLVVGPEPYLIEQVVSAIRAAVLATAPPGLEQFNEEKLTAGEAEVDRVLRAAKVAPMIAKMRLVTVRAIERWDSRAGDAADDDDGDEPRDARDLSPLDRLADYAAAPVSSTCVVLSGARLDNRRKVALLAKKQGWLVPCEPLARNALPGWIREEAKASGHPIAPEVADLLAEIAGPELAYVADALERMGLFVGPGAPITEEAIEACVIRMRQSTIWELVSAVGNRDLGKALSALDDVYDPRDRGLRLVGVLAWSVRQLLKFDVALRGGASPDEAARRAGAPPFKARELEKQTRAIPEGKLERWLTVLAATDLALKGSRRPPRATLETTIIDLCAG